MRERLIDVLLGHRAGEELGFVLRRETASRPPDVPVAARKADGCAQHGHRQYKAGFSVINMTA
jgi:hypothetical protein